MTARLRTPTASWPQRAGVALLALLGPCMWLALLGVTHALAGQTCSLRARLGLSLLAALGISVCGLFAVLSQRRLRQHEARDPEARYLMLASGTLHLMCALTLLAQLVPIVLGVACRQ